MPVTQEERTALALAALSEITDPADVGEVLSVEEVEPGVVDVRFGCTLPAYVGWHWTVSTTDLPDQEPTVLEVELLPGDGALLAPPWVPWAERLAEWRRQHPDERHPDDEADEVDGPDDESAEHDDADLDETDVDEDDLVVDDGLDDLDDADLDNVVSPEEAQQDSGDLTDEDDDERDDDAVPDDDEADAGNGTDDDDDEDEDDDGYGVRPALEDRSL